MIYLTSMQIAFIIVVPIIVIVGLFLLLRFPFAHLYQRLNFNNYVYHRIYRIVLNNDYYLINNYVFSIDEVHKVTIDHIIFAEKYIYLISSYYMDGDITGDKGDQSLILYPKNGKKIYIKNPLVQSKLLLDQLNFSTDLDKSLFICVALVNDSVNLTLNGDGKQFYIIQNKKLKPLIKAIESRDIDPMDDELLKKCVDAFSVNNRRKD